ncbi:MAG: hypothetical protein KAR87_06495 [Candidatus Aenigmarchaeota archaeon]|nr:hypothetical protein [Candidatus Aenigmarchaeota archaeon]
MNKTIFLMTILLLAGVVSADAGNAFPQDEAGISAYVNVGGSINLEDVVGAYYQIEELSETHAIGLISIGNGVSGGSDVLRVYVDTDGWIVAYLKRDEQRGKMIQWSGINLSNPVFERTTMSDAISRMCTVIDVNYTEIEGNVEYYDFKYPNADKIKIFANTRITNGYDYTTILMPANYTLYEAVFSLVGSGDYYNTYLRTNLYIDGVKRGEVTWMGCGAYGTYFTLGEPHTIRFYGIPRNGWAGVASILIYS